MDTQDYTKAPGHWILAKMGKKVLRPGGRKLTEQLVSELKIGPEDNIVEFAPGMGFTARLTIAQNPHSYIGIDTDEDVVRLLINSIIADNTKFLLANASDTKLNPSIKDKVYGEAMLTMHADHRKSEIMREANRILKMGGIYAIHEMALVNVNETQKQNIQKDLAKSLHVNACPITVEEWKTLLEKEGFKIKKVIQHDMRLLNPRRIVDDEGWGTALKVWYNIFSNPPARKRIMDMKKTFAKHRKNINSIVIIAEKM